MASADPVRGRPGLRSDPTDALRWLPTAVTRIPVRAGLRPRPGGAAFAAGCRRISQRRSPASPATPTSSAIPTVSRQVAQADDNAPQEASQPSPESPHSAPGTGRGHHRASAGAGSIDLDATDRNSANRHRRPPVLPTVAVPQSTVNRAVPAGTGSYSLVRWHPTHTAGSVGPPPVVTRPGSPGRSTAPVQRRRRQRQRCQPRAVHPVWAAAGLGTAAGSANAHRPATRHPAHRADDLIVAATRTSATPSRAEVPAPQRLHDAGKSRPPGHPDPPTPGRPPCSASPR